MACVHRAIQIVSADRHHGQSHRQHTNHNRHHAIDHRHLHERCGYHPDGRSDSITYTLGTNAELSTSGDDWTLDLSSITPLALGTYDVIATSGDGSSFLSDTSTNELVIQAASDSLLLSTWDNETLGGLSFGDDDIVEYDQVGDTATLFFDGGNLFSNNGEDIDAIHYRSDGNILVIFTAGGATLGGLTFEDGDVV